MKQDYIETHLAKHEYIEGPQATAKFERLAKAAFRAKKIVAPVKSKKGSKKAVRRKPSGKSEA